MNKGCHFIDGEKQHRQHPLTFSIPSKKELKALKKGDFVKVGVTGFDHGNISGERFWVLVDRVDHSGVRGQVHQGDMLFSALHGIWHGDIITFKHKNILTIGESRS